MLFAFVRREGKMLTTGNKHDERWRELCEAIMHEPDSKRLMELLEKLNRILEEGEKNRGSKRQPSVDD
jgi:hypothetical protein